MKPKVVERDAFTVLGAQERFTPDNEDHEGIWKRFMAHHDLLHGLSTDKACYGVNFDVPGRDDIDYLAGMAVPPDTARPDGLALREVPAARCAVFSCTVATIHNTYEHIFLTWIRTSPHIHDGPKPCFEQYAPGTDSGQSEVLIHIPIRTRRKGASDGVGDVPT